jgi:TonB family C-terminal domain
MKTKILLLAIIGLIINSVMGCSSKTNHSETQPTFQGKSANSFSTWVMDNITFPEELKGESAKTIVSFIINESGDLKDISIVKSSGYKSFDEEVIRTLKLSPKWTPGKKDDKPIDVKLSLPVIFSSTNTDNNNANENTNYNLEELDEKPLFNNRHMNTFVNWVAGNVTYPEEARNKK